MKELKQKNNDRIANKYTGFGFRFSTHPDVAEGFKLFIRPQTVFYRSRFFCPGLMRIFVEKTADRLLFKVGVWTNVRLQPVFGWIPARLPERPILWAHL